MATNARTRRRRPLGHGAVPATYVRWLKTWRLCRRCGCYVDWQSRRVGGCRFCVPGRVRP